jgi:hypothetical protein
MANPNIIAATAMYGKTAVLPVTTTPTDIVQNGAGSNKLLKVSSLIISNINGAQSSDITASIFRGSVEYLIAYTIVVPPDATVILVSKDAPIYLEEGDSLRLTGYTDNFLMGICSYEEIS